MISLLLSLAFASETVCVKQTPTKHPVCIIQDYKDLVIKGKNCKSILIDDVKLELVWFGMTNPFYREIKYEGLWQCSWCWKCD